MRIVIAGASGLIGGVLTRHWEAIGHEVYSLVRREPRGAGEIPWDPAAGQLNPTALEGFDLAVCLSGAGITDARWTDSRKKLLLDSRIGPCGLLAQAVAQASGRPKCLICASATGIYGMDRGGEVLTEQSEPGSDFTSELCQAWEEAAAPARDAGIRVVNLRFSVVLSPQGGALQAMLTPFRLGLGGPIGSGSQYFSWVSLDEVPAVVDYVVVTDSIEGPVNVAAPSPVTNREFAAALGRVLHRPAVLPVPGLVLRMALGEMSGLILGSSRVYPRVLEESGYKFRHPELESALRELLNSLGTP